jgi:hypothetical protein
MKNKKEIEIFSTHSKRSTAPHSPETENRST